MEHEVTIRQAAAPHGTANTHPLLTLLGWDWQLIRKPCFVIGAVMAAVQLLLLLLAAVQSKNMGVPFHALFWGSSAVLAFPVAYLAVLIIGLRPVLQLNGKSKGGYTLLTLPYPRSALLGAHCLSVMVALLGLIAWQVVLCAAYYFPITAISDALAEGNITGVALQYSGRFFRSVLRNKLLNVLLPSTLGGVARLALMVICPAVLVCCGAYHKPRGRAVSVGLALLGTVACGVLAERSSIANEFNYDTRYDLKNLPQAAAVALLGLTLLAWCWALRSVKRADFM